MDRWTSMMKPKVTFCNFANTPKRVYWKYTACSTLLTPTVLNSFCSNEYFKAYQTMKKEMTLGYLTATDFQPTELYSEYFQLYWNTQQAK
jgi:hypothetical protein